ncbi:MAG TPA: hypothetical protein VFQ38_07895 [Longimicrobiales bacterium]|nr:hypothetical protein [Longimicrobiales bacterium]
MTRRWLVSLLFLALLAAPAVAHEHGRIYLGAPRASAGDSLALRGEKLSKATTFRVLLRGPLASYPLGEVKTDRAGAFQGAVRLPADARPGAYTVVLLAPDGDVSARADLALAAAEAPATAGAPPTAGPAAGTAAPATATDHMAHMAAAAPHATAAPMELPKRRGAGEWAVIALVTLVCLGAGARLLRPARA